MVEKVNATYKAEQIIADYQDGSSVAELGGMYGMSTRWIYRILKDHNVPLRPKSRRRPISPVHYNIALVLREDLFTMGLTSAAAANRVGWSYQKMAAVMNGVAPLDVLDLQTLATFLKRSYDELMTPKKRATADGD